MLNWIWLSLFVLGVWIAALLGNLGGDSGIVETAFSMTKVSVLNIALPLAGYMMLWLGMMRLAEKAGLVEVLARFLRPLMKKIFPDVPGDHPAMGSMIMNMAANILGLGNAATPLGLKAMKELDELNPHKGMASNAMCTFLAINTSSVTLIPATAVGLLAAAQIPQPHSIIGTSIVSTLCSTLVALLAVKSLQNLPYFKVKPLLSEDEKKKKEKARSKNFSTLQKVATGLLFVSAAIVFLLEFFPQLRSSILEATGLSDLLSQAEARKAAAGALDDGDKSKAAEATGALLHLIQTISIVAIPLIFLIFTGMAAIRRVRIFEEFVEGAKEGFNVAVRIMPFLVAMLVAMGVFRDSGAMLLLQWALTPVLDLIQIPVDLLPMALMRPLSGGGSMGILSEILSAEQISDTIKYTAGTMFGSTETTFYVLAVYFGSVSIRRTRHALAAGLIADAAGFIAAVTVCRFVFG